MGVVCDGKTAEGPGLRCIGGNAPDIHDLLCLIGPDRAGQGVDCFRDHRPVLPFVGQSGQGELGCQYVVVGAQRLIRRRSQILALVDQRPAVIVLYVDVTPDKIACQRSRKSTRRCRKTHSALAHLLAEIRVPTSDQDRGQSGELLVSGSVPISPVVAAERLKFRLDRDIIAVFILHCHCFCAQDLRNDFVRITLREHRQDMVLVVAFEKELNFLLAPDRLDITRRTDADQVFTVYDRVFDIVVEVAGRRQFVLVAENTADRLDPKLSANAPRNDVALDPVLDLYSYFGVQLCMTI